MLSRNIPRISADNSLRMMNAFAAAQSAEGYKKAAEGLQREVGDFVLEEAPEPEGMEQLRGLMKRLR